MKAFLKLILILIQFGMKMSDALKDKKIKWNEVPGLVFSAWGIWSPISEWDEIKEVLLNFTPERKEETIAYIKEHLDLPDEELEKLIEEGVSLLLANYTFIMKFVNKDETGGVEN